MTVAAVKGKLHEYIENIDEKKLQTLFALLENEIEDRAALYDEAALANFRNASEEYKLSKTKGYPMKESISRLKDKIAQK